MDILFNSTKAVQENAGLILAILAFIAWGALIVFAILKRPAEAQLDDADLVALALGAWPVPSLLISSLYLLLHLLGAAGIASAVAMIVITTSACLAIFSIFGRVSREAALPVLVFLFLIFVRIGFVANLILPPYFDSAEHYRIIRSLLDIGPFHWPETSYYHLGYHAIAAALTSLSGADLSRVMLVLGQVILAALPMPMYFMVRRATGSRPAALVGMSLAALGWSMPAHALNWGKYPALLGLLVLQSAAGAVMLRKLREAAGTVLAAVFIHTRALVLLAALAGGWLLSRIKFRLAILAAVLLLGTGILLLWRDPLLRAGLEPYLDWVTLGTLVLAIPALKHFRPLVLASILVLAGMLAAMLISIRPDLSLLDRPLTEMALYLPLAFLGGLGASRLSRPVTGLLVLAIAIHAWAGFDFTPSACCRLAGPDDAAALDWIARELPTEAHVGIAAADVSITSNGAPLQNTGVDAGIWVTPLTGRGTTALPYFIDFTQPQTHELLCAENLTYIYAGGTGLSFRMRSWAAYPEWYRILFNLPGAQVIQILSCGSAR